MSTFDAMMTIEDGPQDLIELAECFQVLIDDGIVWKLQGGYGRTAKALIDAGHCTMKGAK